MQETSSVRAYGRFRSFFGALGIFGHFLETILWSHGGRRFIAVTLPSWLIAGTKIISTYMYPLPDHNALAFIWKPNWWSWGLALQLGSLLIASYLAWREQFLRVRALTARPDVTLQLSMPGGQPLSTHHLRLENASAHIAVGITAKDISIRKPQRVLETETGIEAAFEIGGEPMATQWTINFSRVEKLGAADGAASLNFVIGGLGAVQSRDPIRGLEFVMARMSSTLEDRALPFTLEFSNLGSPKRKWHSHYSLIYGVRSQSLSMKHLCIDEVVHGESVCPCCLSAPSRNHSTLQQKCC